MSSQPPRKPHAPQRADAGVAPARRCAYAVLRRVFDDGAYADRAFAAAAAALNARDRALAMRLAYGAVQRAGTLDHLIGALAERPAATLDAPLLAALRLGAYELLYTRGAPHYAIVADAVQLAKAHARAGHGLVNAVLRRAIREGPDTLLAGLDDRTPEHAAVKHSHPLWLAQLWWQELGAEDARALMAADNQPSEVALRANTLVMDAPALARQLPVRTHRDPAIAEAVVLEEPFDAHSSPLWQQGAFHAQSRAAMLVAHALDPRPGERVLDLCAAPGGKSTHIAALMHGHGEVLAVERNPARAARLARTAQRLHAANVHVRIADAAAFPPGERPQGERPPGERPPGERPLAERPQAVGFDRVLVDPPCSGLGTLQARADLRWRVTPQSLAELAGVQARILAAGARALRPGGVLVYSTCTISTIENERLIAAFLDSHPDFTLDGPGRLEAHGLHGSGALLTLPHRHHTAGFFVARLRRS
ncbi:MAG TPA: 16S rRNA (cytosine(967)-C(5))-methyltransferase RsmB [Solirubrobacteraceae bacterium]|nr:16S rRNA (cytosine(967)-C(5))-methyltransferase RsmB [Solirubrobacteraceae bacterium]